MECLGVQPGRRILALGIDPHAGRGTDGSELKPLDNLRGRHYN